MWRIARFILGIALGAFAFYALNGQRNELVGASAELANLRVFWLILAIGAEVASFTYFGALQQRLLLAGGVSVGLKRMTVMTLAAGAIADSMPAGPAFASVFAYRYYRRKGANDAVAVWTLFGTLICSALGLSILAMAGVLLAVSEGAAYGLIGVIVGVLLLSVVADAIIWQRRWLAHVVVHALLVSRRVIGRPHRHGLEIVEEFLEKLEAVKLRRRDVVSTILLSIGNWGFDCACLTCSFAAVGAPVPWRGLLLAYGAGQLAANLPVTPGGLGLVEGSLTIALVAFGGSELSTVAAVLCYRIVSFWGYLPVGWGSWASMTFLHRRHDQHVRAHLPSIDDGPHLIPRHTTTPKGES